MRLSPELPKSFWVEAVNYACSVTNRSPAAGIDFKVLEEVWSGKPVDYSMLRIFGCLTYVHVQSGERSKLDSKSKKCICLGLESGVKGYRLWDLVSKKKIVSRDVVFDEAYMLRKGEDEASTKSQKGKQVVEVELDEQRSLTDICDDEESSRDSEHRKEPYSLARGREKHDRKALERYGFKDVVSFALIAGSEDSSSVQNGMPTEVELLHKGKAWESTELLRAKKAKGCRWVYKKKEPTEKVVWPRGLADKHDSLSKPGPMLKFKRCLDLSVTCGM
jgi:hypothetical protein